MPNRYTAITTTNLDTIYRNALDLVYFDITSPTGKHRHPQALIRTSAEQMLAEGYKLYLQ